MQLYSNQQTAGKLMIVKKLAITAAIATLMASHAIYAEEHHEAERDHHAAERGHEAVRDHHVFAVRDVHRFNRAELKLWRGGRWNKTCFWVAAAGGGLPRGNGIFMTARFIPIRSWSPKSTILSL